VTPQLARALAFEPDLEDSRLELRLVGRDTRKLDLVVAAADRAAARGSASVSVTGTTDVDQALTGADIVVNQIRPGGLAGRAFDERFPRALGLPGEETMGPGGFANAWRTLPAVEEIFARCQEVAPAATVLNLTNPAGMVHQVAKRAQLDMLTLCDSPVTLARVAAAAAGVGAESVVPRYIGTNHGGWLTGLGVGDEDVLPEALERTEVLASHAGVDPELIRRLRAVPNPYLRYLYYPERQLAVQSAKRRVRAEELLDLESEALDAFERDRDPAEIADKRVAVWYTECVSPVVGALVSGRPLLTIAGVTNGELVPWLPPETMLELPVQLGGDSVHPSKPDELAPESAALLLENATYESLAVEAILTGDRSGSVRALAANPMVTSIDVAEAAVTAIEREFGALRATS